MIKVHRGPEPEGFEQRSADWQQRFVEAQQQNTPLSAAQFWSQIRRELRSDAQILYRIFQGKCAFCEAKMLHVASAHIEHYQPKSNPQFSHLMFAWDNWLLACPRCNAKKSKHFPDCNGQPCLLDPTAEEPGEHLDFFGAQMGYKTERGQSTIKLIGLDRVPLLDDRAFWLNTINSLLLLLLIPEASHAAREFLIWAMQADAPYAAMTRAYLHSKVPRLAQPALPHPFVQLEHPLQAIARLVEQYAEQLQQLE